MTRSTRKTNAQRRETKKAKQAAKQQDVVPKPAAVVYGFQFTKDDIFSIIPTPNYIPKDVWLFHIMKHMTQGCIKVLRLTCRGFLYILADIQYMYGMKLKHLLLLEKFVQTVNNDQSFINWPTKNPTCIRVEGESQYMEVNKFITSGLQKLKLSGEIYRSIEKETILSILSETKAKKCNRIHTIRILRAGIFDINHIDSEVLKALPACLKNLSFVWPWPRHQREKSYDILRSIPCNLETLTIKDFTAQCLFKHDDVDEDMMDDFLAGKRVSKMDPMFPPNLTRLKLIDMTPESNNIAGFTPNGNNFSTLIWNHIPKTLVHLYLNVHVNDGGLRKIFTNAPLIESFVMMNNIECSWEFSKYLPPGLKSLSIRGCGSVDMKQIIFPNKLVDLSIGPQSNSQRLVYERDCIGFPETLKRLSIYGMEDRDYKQVFSHLPKRLERLRIRDAFDDKGGIRSRFETDCLQYLPSFIQVIDTGMHLIIRKDTIITIPKSLKFIIHQFDVLVPVSPSPIPGNDDLAFFSRLGCYDKTAYIDGHFYGHFFCRMHCPFSTL